MTNKFFSEIHGMTLKTEDFQKKILGFGTSVHNGLNQNRKIPAAGIHIPHFFIGTFDFSEALLYNGFKGGRMI